MKTRNHNGVKREGYAGLGHPELKNRGLGGGSVSAPRSSLIPVHRNENRQTVNILFNKLDVRDSPKKLLCLR